MLSINYNIELLLAHHSSTVISPSFISKIAPIVHYIHGLNCYELNKKKYIILAAGINSKPGPSLLHLCVVMHSNTKSSTPKSFHSLSVYKCCRPFHACFFIFSVFVSHSLPCCPTDLTVSSPGSIKGRRSSYLLAITTERSKSCDEGLNTFRDEGRMFS